MTPAQLAKAAKNAANLDLFTRNILSVYYAANPPAVQHGGRWYADAMEISANLAATYGVTPEQAAGVIASTSPQKDWGGNVVLAERILQNHKAGITAVAGKGYLTLGLRKCDAILALDNPTPSDVQTVLNGQKISNFFLAILGNGAAVCVDGHAFNIAQHGLKRVGISSAGSLTPLQYNIVADAYRAAAAILGITGTACQAVTWVTYREFTK